MGVSAAGGPQESVDSAEPAHTCRRAPGRALEPRHGFAKLQPLHRLHQKIAAAAANAGNHRLPIRMKVGGNYIEIRRGLRHFFESLSETSPVSPDKSTIKGGIGMALQILS